MSEVKVYLQGGEGVEKVIGGWSDKWDKVFIDYDITLTDYGIPFGSKINSITFSEDVSCNIPLPRGYVRLDIYENPITLENHAVSTGEHDISTSWKHYHYGYYGRELAEKLPFINNGKPFKVRLNCKGTDRKWYFRNSMFTINYTEPVYVGITPVKKIYIGNTPVKAIYRGVQQIY